MRSGKRGLRLDHDVELTQRRRWIACLCGCPCGSERLLEGGRKSPRTRPRSNLIDLRRESLRERIARQRGIHQLQWGFRLWRGHRLGSRAARAHDGSTAAVVATLRRGRQRLPALRARRSQQYGAAVETRCTGLGRTPAALAARHRHRRMFAHPAIPFKQEGPQRASQNDVGACARKPEEGMARHALAAPPCVSQSNWMRPKRPLLWKLPCPRIGDHASAFACPSRKLYTFNLHTSPLRGGMGVRPRTKELQGIAISTE